MLVVIPKWKVSVEFDDDELPAVSVFWVHETHMQNVYSLIQKIDFGRDIRSIGVSAVKHENPQIGVSHA